MRPEQAHEREVTRGVGGSGEYERGELPGGELTLAVAGRPEFGDHAEERREIGGQARAPRVRLDPGAARAGGVDPRPRHDVFLLAVIAGEHRHGGEAVAVPAEEVVGHLLALPLAPLSAEHEDGLGEEAHRALGARALDLVVEVPGAGVATDLAVAPAARARVVVEGRAHDVGRVA